MRKILISKDSKVCYFKLQGGLGNQLFIFYAGWMHWKATGQEVRFDISLIDRGFTAHGTKLTSFDLPKEIILENSPIHWSEKYLSNIFRRRNAIYQQKGSGFDGVIGKEILPKIVSGYFQSWIYHDYFAQSPARTLELKSTSRWFKKFLRKMHEEKPISVHVRRGDYKKLVSSYGLLDIQYFLDGVNALNLEAGLERRNIWLFSDSPGDLGQLSSELSKSFSVKVVEPPLHVDPAESMILMSKSAGLVISNSSFSWWAAAFSSDETPVVAPATWYQNMQLPELIHNPNWIQVPSSWETTN